MVHFEQGFFLPIPKPQLSRDSLQIRFHSLPESQELFTVCEIPTHLFSFLFLES